MKKETENNEAIANNGLMKKTKSELVQIILRKDDVERKQMLTIKQHEDSCKTIKQKLDVLANINEEYERSNEENTKTIRKYRIGTAILLVTIIIELVLLIL